MTMLSPFLSVSTVFCGLFMTASAQPTEAQWRAAFDAGMARVAENALASADELLKRALELAAGLDPAGSQVAQTLNSLGVVYQHLRRPLEAERYYRRAMTIYEALPRSGNLALARVGNNLARLYLENGRISEAEKLLRQVLTWSSDDAELVRTHEYLAIIAYGRRKYAQAGPLFLETVELCRRVAGPGHPETALALNGLGVVEIEEGRTTDGLGHLSDALGIFERTLGRRHPGAAVVLANLGWAYARMRRPQQAEPLLREAWTATEAAYGPADVRTADVISKYADVLQRLNRRAEARELRKRSSQILANAGPLNSMRLAVDITSLRK